MPSTISCVCGKTYRIPPGMEGKSFRCKACNAKMRVPAESGVNPSPTGPVEALGPSEIDKTLIGREGTVAGNPAMLTFNLAQYAKCFPMVMYLPAIFAIAGPLGALMLTKSLFVGAMIGVGTAYFVKESVPAITKRKLHAGDLCAAIVIDTNPYTVAVLTDLCSDGSGPKLAIKILRQPLAKMAGGAPQMGAKVVTAALYFGTVSKGTWDNFSPIVVNCACAELKQIERALASIEPADWVLLKRMLATLKSREPGLYKLWEST